jgi:5,6-dimethylbenzimidazole synthase
LEHKRSISILHEDAIQKQHGYDTKEKVQRKQKYLSLELKGIIESAVNICVTYGSTRFGSFILDTRPIPETGIYSVCCAIQNLWLAARAGG